METIGAMLLAGFFVVFFTAVFAIFRPLPQFWLESRRKAGLVAAGAFVLMVGMGQLIPEDAFQEPKQEVRRPTPPPVTTVTPAPTPRPAEPAPKPPLENLGFINYRTEIIEQIIDPCLFLALRAKQQGDGTYRGDDVGIWQSVEWEKRMQSHLVDRAVRSLLPEVRSVDPATRQRWYTAKRIGCTIDDRGTTLGQFVLGLDN